ncbi:MAG: cysteine synthase family protein [Armatimonadetes bacterium]|nr:cysteine synthase family protein [Armatimonadota bacterium]
MQGSVRVVHPGGTPEGAPHREVGNTPLIEIDGVFAKLECVNPCGSVKDRIADYILGRSRELGLLEEGQPIVEATSGNTGISMTYYGTKLGHQVTIVMPENMTEERKGHIRRLGATLIECSKEGSFAEAAAIRDDLASSHGWFNPDQFSNPLNVECHAKTTARELLDQIGDRKIDAFVAGVGTGGTLIGVGAGLREVLPNVRIVAVEPAESAVMTGGEPGPHSIFGIGDGFIPAIASDGKGGLHPMIDEVAVVSSEEAIVAARELRGVYGKCVGISSGANFVAARRLRERFETVATVFADGFGKYISYGLIAADCGACPFEPACLEREKETGIR